MKQIILVKKHHLIIFFLFYLFTTTICQKTPPTEMYERLLQPSTTQVMSNTAREVYFNGTAYIRLHSTLSLHKQIGLSFRTCHGEELFSQSRDTGGKSRTNIALSVYDNRIHLIVTIGKRPYVTTIESYNSLHDNKWHTIDLIYRSGNLTMYLDGINKQNSQLVANETYHSEILTNPELYSEDAILIVGNSFKGCMLEGPSLIFTNNVVSSHHALFGSCPAQDTCNTSDDYSPQNVGLSRRPDERMLGATKQPKMSTTDFCFNDPCMRHGICMSHSDRYECKCGARYKGKNCEVDIGPPCLRQTQSGIPACLNGGTCLEDSIGDISCKCTNGFIGVHCENEIEINPLCENHPCKNNGSCSVIPNTSEYHCMCVPGFAGDNCEININECLRSPCQNSGKCIDGINSFTCDCQDTGYHGPTCEIDIDECIKSPCLNQGTCFNYYGSYVCQCRDGYWGKNCEIILNECGTNPCKNNGHCVNDIQGSKCICLSGFSGTYCENKIDFPCSFGAKTGVGECPPYADCTELYGNYQCVCKPGISRAVAPSDGFYNCTEVHICKNNPCMNSGTCIPLGDSYQCVCLPGYTGYYCQYPISCKNRPCQHSSICQDYIGGYYCACDSGWTGKNCDKEINECYSNPCRNNGVCINLLNAFRCKCLPGFTGKHCQQEMNKCLLMPCKNGGNCRETATGFNCTCTEAWMGPTCERPYDVCLSHNPCLNNGTCLTDINNPRQFSCKCVKGFAGVTCEKNIDDCIPGSCPDNRICVDGINAFECQCPPGYRGDNCSIPTFSCESPGACINGSCKRVGDDYVCQCSQGFKGKRCDEDIDECETRLICNYGICVNNIGGFECFCRPGYTGNLCDQDFDECLSQPCKNEATCINKINNYECVCPAGFTAKDCSVDIDECLSNPCAEGSTCINGIASFQCVCPAGLSGPLCNIDIDDCLSAPCQNNGKCKDGINSYTCDCDQTGFTGEHCDENIDDCVSNPCENNAICIDQILDYTCDCFPGYTGKNCETDIDECASIPCQNGGTCLQRSNITLYKPEFRENLNFTLPETFTNQFSYNNSAGYECLCVDGITGLKCEINVNECESNPCINGQCSDHVGYYKCECDDGFEGPQCETNIDECKKYKPCIHGTCYDRKADYYCECNQGFGGKNCSVELIGCLQEGACLNNGTCKPYLENETHHKFNCSCTNGYHGATCQNVTTMSMDGNSYIVVNTTRDEGYDIQFRFKTTLANGLLAIGKGVTYYILELVNGRLNLHSSLLNKWEGVFIGSNLNDGKWQKVFVAINSSHLVLSANEEQTIYPINLNEGSNTSHTSFPTTYFLGTIRNLRQLTHGPSFFVGCAEDVVINGEWVLPENNPSTSGGPVELQNVKVGCPREPQCEPNPCHSGGHCTDLWRTFNCSCERPYIGHTCQYNYTAATFGHENITNSLVTVTVNESARRAVRYIAHISMFIRTRQNKGQIFCLGSAITAANLMEKTYIAAELEGGELLVRIQFNATPESYTVGGVKLDNGYNHLIEISRNVTLVQVKLNGTEYFRKTIGANGQLDVQTLYLGGLPQISRPVRQADLINAPSQSQSNSPHRAELNLGVANYKGIIQDVQISNGTRTMIVEFFALKKPDLEVPMSFGDVYYENGSILEGIISDDMCRINPCQNNGTCFNTWNDFNCDCEIGYKGKICDEMEFCQLQDCPSGSMCKNLNNGYECIANATLDGHKPALMYDFTNMNNTEVIMEKMEINYRTNRGGTLFYAQNNTEYFIVGVYKDQIFVQWKLKEISEQHVFKKGSFDGEWTSILFTFKDNVLKCGFKDFIAEDNPKFVGEHFDTEIFINLMTKSKVIVGGGFNFYDKDGVVVVEDVSLNQTSFTGFATTESGVVSNSVDIPLIGQVTENPHFLLEYGENFTGCIGEIRLGEFLLPYFTIEELNSSNINSEQYFSLNTRLDSEIGCVLCFDTNCLNGGKCLNAETEYVCKCLPGFEADDCSVNIDECADSKCKHGSKCVDGIANYTCTCTIGWTGWLCDQDINECLSDPCLNGATCQDNLGYFKCICPDGYSGTQCEVPPLITCNNNPCKNNSRCIDDKNPATGNNFTCDCAPGFVGDFCDTPYCIEKPCQHGNCTIIMDLPPICTCILGYNGKYCEIDVDDCILPNGESPCQNGGRCIDGVNSYTCDCVGTGFKGDLCQEDIDECVEYAEQQLCGNDGGECINYNGSYHCNCPTGFCGHKCKLQDPCYTSLNNISRTYGDDDITRDQENKDVFIGLCGEHGKCIEICDYEPMYRCECFDGYNGGNCSSIEEPLQRRTTSMDIAIIVIPIIVVLLMMAGIGLAVLVAMARSKRATRGTYSPSAQEFCNPRVEMDHVLKPPPEERLI